MLDFLKPNPAASMLKADHRKVEKLFDQFEKAKGRAYPVDVLNTESRGRPKGVVSLVQNCDGKEFFMGYEHCEKAGNHWFNPTKPNSVDELFQLYQTVRKNGSLMLDVGPQYAVSMAKRLGVTTSLKPLPSAIPIASGPLLPATAPFFRRERFRAIAPCALQDCRREQQRGQ